MPVFDRRIEKTKQAIIEALEALMVEKRYTQITVQEIIDKANVGRTTFYTHFPTKDDLLKSCIEKNIDDLKGGLNYFDLGESEGAMFSIANLLVHIKEHKKLIKGLMNSEVSELLYDQCRVYWKDKFLEHLNRQHIEVTKSQVPEEILLNHVTGSLVNLIKWWIDTGMKEEPEKMAAYWMAMTMPVISSMLQNMPH